MCNIIIRYKNYCMKNMKFKIRPIHQNDNSKVSYIINHVLKEHGCIGEGWGSSDSEVNNMYDAYQGDYKGYYVVENEHGEVIGCGGFAALQGATPEEQICELRKLYLLAETRGLGVGKKLLEYILLKAKDAEYKEIYLETTPALSAAVGLYEKLNFRHLPINRGNTGHQEKCNIFMIRQL